MKRKGREANAFSAVVQQYDCRAAGFAVWLCSGKADWAKGRYLSSNWDVDALAQLKDRILEDDLLVNRLRTKA